MNGQQQPKVKGVVDIVFLLDITGSMEPCINAVKDNIQAFVATLTAKDANGGAAGAGLAGGRNGLP